MFANIFSRHAAPPNYAMRSSGSNEKSVFRIVSYSHSGPAKLARLAKDQTAFSGEEDKLIIRNSAIAKILQLLAPISERRIDRNNRAGDYYPQFHQYKNLRAPYGNIKWRFPPSSLSLRRPRPIIHNRRRRY